MRSPRPTEFALDPIEAARVRRRAAVLATIVLGAIIGASWAYLLLAIARVHHAWIPVSPLAETVLDVIFSLALQTTVGLVLALSFEWESRWTVFGGWLMACSLSITAVVARSFDAAPIGALLLIAAAVAFFVLVGRRMQGSEPPSRG